MKFSNGFWLDKAGCVVSRPLEVRSYDFDGHTLTLYVPHRPIQNRGDTLNLTMSTLSITAPCKNILHIEHVHHLGACKPGPFYDLKEEKTELTLEEQADCLILKQEDLVLVIHKSPYQLTFYYKGKKLTTSPSKASAWITDENKQSYMREQLSLSVGETVYGLGERFGPFVKNGQTVDMWQADGGTCSEQAYKNVPFYLTSQNYGVFVTKCEDVSFEVASEVVSRVSFTVPGQSLGYDIISGDDPKAVLERYTFRSGRPALLPDWSYGLWLSTSFTTDYDEKTIQSFIDGMKQRDLPFNVFHFDCFWMKESEWCNFEWDGTMFHDPEGMLARLKQQGLHICVWINPYIAQKSPLFKEAMTKGYLLKNTNGTIFQTDLWQAGMGIVDFTHPEAKAWYQSHLRRLLAQGVDCFKTDFGERIPTHVHYHDGSDPVKMHNYYTYLYNQAVFEVLEEERGKGEAVLFSRSATATCQKFPLHWGGDCSSTYESMAETLRGGLSLGLGGFGYWSHDISGFEDTSTPDLYKRWVAFGLLSSHSRLHGSSSYRVPWLFDEEASDVLRHFTRIKEALMPYLIAKGKEAHEKGWPILRAMWLEFPNDLACRYLDTQYMLGDKILVAPVFNEEGLVSYYLPEGEWYHLLSHEKREGGRWYQEQYNYFSLPLFTKDKALLLDHFQF